MEELSVDLEIAIINLISQIPMSIWLYDDGRTVVASTLLHHRHHGASTAVPHGITVPHYE